MPMAFDPPPTQAVTASGGVRSESAASGISALIVPDREAVLSSQISARVKTVRYQLGDYFPAGAELVTFDCSETIARRESLKAELNSARETHTAKLRLQGLGAAGELEVTLAAAAVERAVANVQQVDAQMVNCTLVSTFAGRISRVRVKPQESVSPGQPVVDIVDTGQLKAQIYLPSNMAVRLRVGQRLKLRFEDAAANVVAQISRMNPRIDGASQMIEVEARIEGNTRRLLPGMMGTVNLESL